MLNGDDEKQYCPSGWYWGKTPDTRADTGVDWNMYDKYLLEWLV